LNLHSPVPNEACHHPAFISSKTDSVAIRRDIARHFPSEHDASIAGKIGDLR
jgi:hypothetical protein